ncbi:iron-sulfur cluster repair di-iron protein [uncultured Gimesia sp.]|uniref:iron-sulfur cluster repair di-iron protein n=1 Tax=uncultured Gimesia sp. TaxID=1678688 RepID=UPI00260B697F|nr:iron-sulfur cluster repair di-iron protein [uncultured Gimesia sp.]
MKPLTNESPVGQWVIDHPELILFLEELQVDYCCGGNKTLSDACHAVGVEPELLLDKLSQARRMTDKENSTTDWSTARLSDLCDHIESTHHVYLKNTLPSLCQLASKVREAHGDTHPELREVESVYRNLCDELNPHMMKEERILFPAIRLQEEATQTLSFPFGTMQNPINMMVHEHNQAGNLLSRLRELTNTYSVPEDACTSYCAFLEGLQQLELDLHQHIHKENNILFPRAAQLVSSRQQDQQEEKD